MYSDVDLNRNSRTDNKVILIVVYMGQAVTNKKKLFI